MEYWFDKDKKKRAEQRRERRFTASVGTAVVSGKTFVVRDWSACGFALAATDRAIQVGDRLKASFKAKDDLGELSFKCQILILRVEPATKTIAGVFIHCPVKTACALEEHFYVVKEDAA